MLGFFIRALRKMRTLILDKVIAPVNVKLTLKTCLGVSIGKSIILRGMPIIRVARQASVKIGDRVTLSSDNKRSHVNMYSPVKLQVGPGASLTIGSDTRIHGTSIHAQQRISIGSRCLIAANCQIIDSSAHELSMANPEKRILSRRSTPNPIVIHDNVWIGTGCIILPGVEIGEGSVIAAGSVVTKSIPPRCLAGGNPARVIRQYDEKGNQVA